MLLLKPASAVEHKCLRKGREKSKFPESGNPCVPWLPLQQDVMARMRGSTSSTSSMTLLHQGSDTHSTDEKLSQRQGVWRMKSRPATCPTGSFLPWKVCEAEKQEGEGGRLLPSWIRGIEAMSACLCSPSNVPKPSERSHPPRHLHLYV